MIIVEPVSGTVGAVVRGVDLSQRLDESTVADIRKAFLAHHVLFFSDQDLSPEAQMRVGRYFGELDTHPFVEGMESHPEVIEVITEPDDRLNFGGGWHSDVTFLDEPDLASLLYAIEVPPFGGDTLFANQHAAYEALSDTMKDLLDGLTAKHSAGPQYAEGGYSTLSKSMKTK
jgi:taurine dioxygenase